MWRVLRLEAAARTRLALCWCAGPIAELVQRRAVPVDRLEICLGPPNLDVVERWGIERLVIAEAQVGPAGADQGGSLRYFAGSAFWRAGQVVGP